MEKQKKIEKKTKKKKKNFSMLWKLLLDARIVSSE